MCNSASVQKMLKSFVSLLWKNTFCPSLSWLNYEIGELDQLRWGNLINKFHDILCHMETYLVIFNHISSYSYISCNIESHPHWFHKTVAKYNQFYVNDRVLDHQMWFPLLWVLETLRPSLIDTVAPIVLTGTLLEQILLPEVEMAAPCILWILGPLGGRVICE